MPALPETVTRYLSAHSDHDTAAQLALFAADATVVDEGRTHDGAAAIAAWMNETAEAFTYTITPLAAEQSGERQYTVTQHLAGDFPGGTVDLRFRFTLRDDLIQHLTIEP
ncbi:nuclear transport factor 2 family protein [Nonomuraea sp. M3C6]|uniref:Nuclear transport factor 2 family protein n=1 Tax=Nonomuraea marmarensis TaxID=3351344 RepID=A0ABW7AD32_9ACTN